jgi:hypothetical protein
MEDNVQLEFYNKIVNSGYKIQDCITCIGVINRESQTLGGISQLILGTELK